MTDFIENYIKDSIQTKQLILNDKAQVANILNISNVIVEAYNKGNKVLIAGNGGSAADAQHFAGELISKFYFDRPALSAIALTTDTSTMTAIGNDYGFEKIFSRQIQANGNKGDVFVAISTSGNSENIVNALIEAKSRGLLCVGFTGKSDCKMDKLCDYIIKVQSSETPKIQESHIMIVHIICAIIEKSLFKN